MALDPHVSRFLDMMALGGTGGIDLAARREGLRGLSRLAAAGLATGGIATREFFASGPGGALTLRLYAPEGEAPGPGLVFLHGGGLVTGDLDTHDAMCRTLCDAGRMRVVAVAYRLAPEHPFPAALDDALAATRWVAEHAGELGIDPALLAVGGESAGAGLAARVCQEMREGETLAAQLLICPVLDVHGTSASRRDFARGYFLDEDTIQGDLIACGPEARPEPRFCPLREKNLAGLPPARIHTAEYDPVRDDGAAYAERLNRAGVPATHARHAGMIHFFYGLGRLVPRSRPILTEIARDFAGLLRSPAPTA